MCSVKPLVSGMFPYSIHDPFSFLAVVLLFFSGICFHDLESHFEMAVVKEIDGKQALGDSGDPLVAQLEIT